MNPFLGVIILGAGASSRMGRPKLLLPWGHTSVIGHLLEQWRRLPSEQVCVVCAPANEALNQELARLNAWNVERIINPSPERGMFSSIQCAASWTGWKRTITHWAISLGDQPQVRTETLRQLLDFISHHPLHICQPSRQGHGRHPVILPTAYFKALAEATEGNLKEFLDKRRDAIVRCELNDVGFDLDLDTPADYERALKFLKYEVE
jgi:molybdenum cofactor cytidylyltransferase